MIRSGHVKGRRFFDVFRNVLSRKFGSSSSAATTAIQEQQQKGSVLSDIAKPAKELKFSDSRAYYGVDKREFQDKAAISSQAYLEACDSPIYRRKVAISFWSSLVAVCVYFWYSRRDYNGFLNAPKYEVVPTLKRYALRHQIEEARKSGKNTAYLEAALAYVDVEEAVYKAEEGAFVLEN